MTIIVSDFVSVSEHIDALGYPCPKDGIAILPVNFETASSAEELRQASEASTIRTIFRNSEVPYFEFLPKDKRPPYIHNNAFDWVIPTLFVSASFFSQNPQAISIALSVIANYATDFFKGSGNATSVKLDIVVETNKGKTCKRISYEGPPEGLQDLPDVIRELSNE